MGKDKEIIIDELVRDAFVFEYQGSSFGLLIGTVSESGEYCVAHLAETLEDKEDSHNAEPAASSSHSSGDTQMLPKSFTKMHLPTISHHVKQVIRMLPGGLVILGVFIVEPIDTIFTTKYEPIIKSILATMNKSLTRNIHYGAGFGTNNEKVVMHYQPATKQYTVHLIDDTKMQYMKVNFRRLEWSKLESEYDTFYAMHLAKGQIGLPLRKNMKVLIDSFQEILNGATYVVNGKRPSVNEPYIEQTPKFSDSGLSDLEDDLLGDHSESTGGNSGSSSPRHQYSDSGNESDSENWQNRPISPLHILIEKTPGVVRPTEPGQDFVTHLHLLGKIATVAFVLSGSSTAFVVEMIKKDIVRSLISRIEMHCESLIEEEEGAQDESDEGTSKVYHEVPRRVFANLLGSKLLVSDYLFPGEGPKDSVASFRDILSLNLQDETQIIMTKERPFNLDELRSKGSLEELLCKVEPTISTKIHRSTAVGFILAMTLLVAMAGILIPLFVNTQ